MKKILASILAFTLIVTGIPFFAGKKASAATYNNFTYDTAYSEITITGGSPVDGLLDVPASINGTSVTKIGANAFINNQEITALNLPVSVKEIGDNAFGNCKNMKTANLAGVESYGVIPFSLCVNLQTVKIGAAVKSVSGSYDPFAGCYNLNSAYFTTTPNLWLEGFFKSCSDGFIIFYSSSTTGWDTFLDNFNKSEFNPELKYTVTYDANGATGGTVPVDRNSYDFNIFFTVADNTGNLVKTGTEFLGWNTDRDGTSVDHFAGEIFDIETDDVVLYAMWSDGRDEGEQLEWIDNVTTWHYTPLGDSFCSIDSADNVYGNLVIPPYINGRKVINISDYAFYWCDAITSVQLPDTLTGLGSYSFGSCKGITSMKIPKGTAYIADDAFADCDRLTNIEVDHYNSYYSSYDGVLFDKMKTRLENCPSGLSICKIPSSVKIIGSGSFDSSVNISAVVIPTSVITIEDYAFYSCSNLMSIEIPFSVAEMGELSIYACSSLSYISVDSRNPSFASVDGVLYDKNITKLIRCPSGRSTNLEIPDSVTQISASGLYGVNISLYVVGTANSSFSSLDGVLFDKFKTTLIQCPMLKTDTYIVPSTVTDIKDGAFSWCMYLKSISLPIGLKSIGTASFMGCISLTTINIPASVTSISDNAFGYDYLLASAYFTGNAPQMGEGVFDFCADEFTIYYPSASSGFTTPTWLSEKYPTLPRASTVIFNSNGGSAVPSKSVSYNTTMTVPAAPTRSGYIFAGWFTSTSYTTPWVFATNKVTANTTLYAKWIASQVTGLKVVSAGYNSLKLTWTASTGASSYEIYRASSLTGIYYLVTTIAATSVPTYTSTALGTGTTYYFKVRAYSLSGTSKTYNNYSTIASAKPLPSAPTGLVSSAASYNSTKLSWTAVAGANGYSVYRATTLTGTYSLIATVTTNTYTKTALTTGATYYYKVNAYRLVGTTKVYGSQCAAIGAKVVPSTPTSLGLSSPSYNSLKLTWTGVYGANGYSVYRATSPTGTYTLLATVTTNSYSNINLVPGTSYYYKVNAYRLVGTTKVYGSQCAAVGRKAVPATITTLTAVRYSATSIKLNWGAISGASGYEIYRSTSATGTYTLLTTLTAISYTNTSLVTGTTYYYKVRAYRLVGTTKVYADFSAVKYAKP